MPLGSPIGSGLGLQNKVYLVIYLKYIINASLDIFKIPIPGEFSNISKTIFFSSIYSNTDLGRVNNLNELVI